MTSPQAKTALTAPDFSQRMDPSRFVNIDLVDENFRQNALADLLEDWATRKPFYVLRNSLPVAICTRYKDVKEVYNNPQRFTVEIPPWPDYKVFDIFGGLENVLQMDGDKHERIRRLMTPAFTPQAVMRLEADIDRIIAEQIDHVAALGSEFDAMEDFGRPIIMRVLLEAALKLKPEQQAVFAQMHDSIALATQFVPGEPFPDEFMAAVGEVIRITQEIVAERRENPGSDMISLLVTARDEGQGLTESELFGQINAICSGGIGTTAATIGGALLMLGKHSDQMDLLRREPALIDSAVEECLRRHGPGILTFVRFATEDTDIDGVPIFKDMPVMASIQAADLDPVEFPDPMAFDIRRNPRGIVAFGSGPHHCIGNRLGRMVMKKAILGLVQRFPQLRLAEGNFKPVYGGFPGELSLVTLPMRVD